MKTLTEVLELKGREVVSIGPDAKVLRGHRDRRGKASGPFWC
jgi:hypothetical protein